MQSINTLTLEFLKLTLPSLNFGMSIFANRDVRNQHRIANSVDLGETAHDEPSHLDLHCLQKYQFRSAGLKGFRV